MSATPVTDELACREFVELVTDYLEDALPPGMREKFEAHLQVCSGCALYLGQMRLVIRALPEPRNGSLAPATKDKMLRRFRAWRSAR